MVLGLSPVPPRQQAAIVVPQDRPVYRITAEKGFFGPDDCLYSEGSIIAWTDEPNREMEPMNAQAEEAMKAYLKKLDDLGRAVAEKAGKSYNSLEDAFENSRAMEQMDAKKVQLIGGKEQAPLMRANKRGPKKIEQIDLNSDVPMTGTKGKLSVGSKNEINKSAGDTIDKSKGIL